LHETKELQIVSQEGGQSEIHDQMKACESSNRYNDKVSTFPGWMAVKNLLRLKIKIDYAGFGVKNFVGGSTGNPTTRIPDTVDLPVYRLPAGQ